MGFFKKSSSDVSDDQVVVDEHEKSQYSSSAPTRNPSETPSPIDGTTAADNDIEAKLKQQPIQPLAVMMGGVASIGGFIFGYESGGVGGFLSMSDFKRRFGQDGKFDAVRQGTIVALLCAGTLLGCLFSSSLYTKFGRKYVISGFAYFYIIGVVIEVTSSTSWVQFAMGRFTAGIGIGALSTGVPMYQSESVPKNIRTVIVSSYQLLITLGIWTAYMVNWGTEATYTNSAQWRIPNGLAALWAIVLGTWMLFLPESPRYAYRMGRTAEARRNLARLCGVDQHSPLIDAQILEIQDQIDKESATAEHWYECFTAPRMMYRILLGMAMQAGQQLTGANFFFYYGTIIFKSTGISNSFVTSIILGSVNVGATIFGLMYLGKVSRRKALMVGAAVMGGCFLIYSFVGHFALNSADPESTPNAGKVLIVFTCIFIAAFATTWGPLVWAVVGELYPPRYRAPCLGMATAANWLFNFLISFFTTFITDAINYFYGLVFAGCCFALIFIVYLFVIEPKDRSLEEIDEMYINGVNPIGSENWVKPAGFHATNVPTKKTETSGPPLLQQVEDKSTVPAATGTGGTV